MKSPPWSFGAGALAGAGLMFAALVTAGPSGSPLEGWVASNLGYSVWPFSAVLLLFALCLERLRARLMTNAAEHDVVALDQLSDIWIQLFIGVGVIWTAVGMRSALQVALADPGDALTDSAGSVLEKLVDGGILLALTTTIVGAVGGYLMRLAKTLCLGTALNRFYALRQSADMRELIEATCRMEQRLASGGPPAPGSQTPVAQQ